MLRPRFVMVERRGRRRWGERGSKDEKELKTAVKKGRLVEE